MKYLELREALKSFPLFSIKDIRKRFPDFDQRRLVEWQGKGYISKIRRGYYKFSDQRIKENYLYHAANSMYSPSYVSLESALSYYGLIPEGVFMVTSVSTRNTANHETSIGTFAYKHIKANLFFGYKLIKEQDWSYKVAEPEKAILDFFYFKNIQSIEDIKGLRINPDQMNKYLDFDKLVKYQKIFNSQVVNRRLDLLNIEINA
ncbi:hypothetical protein [Aquiflexum sp.]|uniref:type IV toxin-antitoxin system AbiEi family antitoxin domain-containing protein n=1 Tax=Aquiflexum sp. TaxID=1872584 RepID=UPI0035938598